MTTGQPQAFSAPPAQSQTVDKQKFSGNLGNTGGLYHRRAALPLRKAGSLILVRVNAAELFPVGIEDADEVVVMFAATIFAERSLALNPSFFRLSFCHVNHPIEVRNVQHYVREARVPQVPVKIVSRTSLHREKSHEGEGGISDCNKRNMRPSIPIASSPNLRKQAKMRVSRKGGATTFGLSATSNRVAIVNGVFWPWT